MPNFTSFTSTSAKTPSLWRPSSNFLWGMAGMGTVMGYIVLRHVQWKSKPDAQKRMLVHHAVFWPVLIGALKGMHYSFGRFKDQTGKKAAAILACAGLAMAGFEGGGWLAKKLFPKQPKPKMPPIPPQSLQLAYQQGMQQGYQAAVQQMQLALPGNALAIHTYPAYGRPYPW